MKFKGSAKQIMSGIGVGASQRSRCRSAKASKSPAVARAELLENWAVDRTNVGHCNGGLESRESRVGRGGSGAEESEPEPSESGAEAREGISREDRSWVK